MTVVREGLFDGIAILISQPDFVRAGDADENSDHMGGHEVGLPELFLDGEGYCHALIRFKTYYHLN